MLSLNHILSLKVHTICFNNVIYCLLVLVFDTYILLFCISLRELVRFYVYLFHGCTEIQNDAYDSHNCQVCQLLQKIFMINQNVFVEFLWNSRLKWKQILHLCTIQTMYAAYIARGGGYNRSCFEAFPTYYIRHSIYIIISIVLINIQRRN